jgi:hypothetical protein
VQIKVCKKPGGKLYIFHLLSQDHYILCFASARQTAKKASIKICKLEITQNSSFTQFSLYSKRKNPVFMVKKRDFVKFYLQFTQIKAAFYLSQPIGQK